MQASHVTIAIPRRCTLVYKSNYECNNHTILPQQQRANCNRCASAASLPLLTRDRNLTRDWDDVWVITGPAFLPKKEGNKWIVHYEVLGGSEPNVAVPTHFWKVILAQKGSNGVMASFLLPNERIDDSTPLAAFMVPLQKIEKATGLIFFENLRGKLQPGAPLQLPLLCNGNACNLPPPMPKNNSHG